MAKPIDLEGLTCKQWRIKKVICLESFFRIPLWGCSLNIVVFFVASCLLLSFAKYLKVHLSLFGLRVYGCSKMSFSLFLPLSGLGQFGKSIVNTHLIQNRARQYFCKNYHACTYVNVNCIKRLSIRNTMKKVAHVLLPLSTFCLKTIIEANTVCTPDTNTDTE